MYITGPDYSYDDDRFYLWVKHRVDDDTLLGVRLLVDPDNIHDILYATQAWKIAIDDLMVERVA